MAFPRNRGAWRVLAISFMLVLAAGSAHAQAPDPGLDFTPLLESLYKEPNRDWRFTGSTAAELSSWQAKTRKKLAAFLGIENDARCPLNLERSLVERRPGFSLWRLSYDTRPDLKAVAYLVLPEKGEPPFPVILCPPGHGQGARQLLAEAGGQYRQYPLHLALAGFAALVPEHAGMGDRVLPGVTYEVNHHYFYSTLLTLGKSPMGYMVWDLMRAADLLGEIPEADRERIGCWGLSLGGALSLFLSALDTRVKAVCVSGYYTSVYDIQLKAAEHDWAHCGCNIVPGLSAHLEHADLAALICPRPFLVESGRTDAAFPIDAARRSVAEARAWYQLAGDPEGIQLMESPGGHEIYWVPQTIEWFSRRLKGPVPEQNK